ncbi:aldo/keto reductase [Pseudomonas sp. DTU_2021_1001937_2_SI_NGA_ILE_001]|uniref:aldo/keto reductase n=1 Tax=Pseudomonas sp. DTU_2021_1001937_2_SI_NGA_ILE_001 TaxID=3077589 RepID=UPI0028FC0FD5|nr:aldo/keto reductase [Pseudomonas sp. DTU_2021_1001937_2_SI_NGA_ILE_001]WNW10016.1 aldo/keto reductase [Pseudomonas sp. DTU_2021_1001937_2_SI_NGA_ILE_001]
MSKQQPIIELSDGNRIPQLGLGVWQASPEQAASAVRQALQAGYRHIDTAAIYENEEGVGQGLQEAGVPREQVFITTKVWNSEQGFDSATRALDASLARLKLDYVDLLLIHWPTPAKDRYVETWKALIQAREQGKVRSIGVSNFNPEHLQRLIDETGVTPVLNQIELHPSFQQRELRQAHERLNIRTESWSPLGQGKGLEHPQIKQIASKHGRSPAQVIIRWHLQLGLIAIPKSVTESRIQENFQVFDFQLDADDLAAIATLDAGERLGPNPATLN